MAEQNKSRPNDARAQRSREALRKAMLELVEVKAFEQISVRDLTAGANLTHPTFYRNYSTKEEVLGEIASEQMQQLMARMVSIADLRDPAATSRTICDYVQDNRKVWTTILTTSATVVLRYELIRLSKEIVAGRTPFNPDVPSVMAAGVVAAGVLEILAWWLQKPEDYPAENVAKFLEWLVLKPTIGQNTYKLP